MLRVRVGVWVGVRVGVRVKASVRLYFWGVVFKILVRV